MGPVDAAGATLKEIKSRVSVGLRGPNVCSVVLIELTEVERCFVSPPYIANRAKFIPSLAVPWSLSESEELERSEKASRCRRPEPSRPEEDNSEASRSTPSSSSLERGPVALAEVKPSRKGRSDRPLLEDSTDDQEPLPPPPESVCPYKD